MQPVPGLSLRLEQELVEHIAALLDHISAKTSSSQMSRDGIITMCRQHEIFRRPHLGGARCSTRVTGISQPGDSAGACMPASAVNADAASTTAARLSATMRSAVPSALTGGARGFWAAPPGAAPPAPPAPPSPAQVHLLWQHHRAQGVKGTHGVNTLVNGIQPHIHLDQVTRVLISTGMIMLHISKH